MEQLGGWGQVAHFTFPKGRERGPGTGHRRSPEDSPSACAGGCTELGQSFCSKGKLTLGVFTVGGLRQPYCLLLITWQQNGELFRIFSFAKLNLERREIFHKVNQYKQK